MCVCNGEHCRYLFVSDEIHHCILVRLVVYMSAIWLGLHENVDGIDGDIYLHTYVHTYINTCSFISIDASAAACCCKRMSILLPMASGTDGHIDSEW